MECVVIGDLHLSDDNGKGGLSNYIEACDAYVMSEVTRVIKYAEKKNISTVVFSGDICDNPRMSYSAMLQLSACVRAYPNTNFIAILGNHDKLGKESSVGHSMQIIEAMHIPNLRVITEDTYIKVDGKKVKFCPWPSTEFDTNVFNVGHTEVHGSKGDSGRAMESDDLSKTKAVVSMGHLHTNHSVRNTYFVGTLYQTNFGESLPKYFHRVEWRSIDDYEIHNVPFDPRIKLFNCVVESQADCDALPRDKNHLIKLVVSDGANVIVPDLPNIVITKAYKTKSELATILTEDLMQGNELEIKTSEFFKDWIANQSIPQSMKQRVAKLRKEILYGT